MSWFTAIKKGIAAPVRAGLAPIKATANVARHPTSIRAHLRAGIAAGLAPTRMASSMAKTSLRLSPAAIVSRKLRAGAHRIAAKTITRGGNIWGGGAGAGGGGYAVPSTPDGDDMPDDDDGGDDGGGEDEDEGLADIDYAAHIDRARGLAGWTDDLQRIGVDLAKGAASGILSSVSKSVSPMAAPPPRAAGMSMTTKVAIGAAVAVPILFVLSRRRSAAAA